MRKTDKIVIAVLALAWALFQLALPRVLILDSIKVRAIHLAFAVVLVFLTLPPAWRRSRILEQKKESRPIPLFNYGLAVLTGAAVLYIMLDWEGVAMRSGRPLIRDVVVSVALILLLLEASRRAIGPALSIIAQGAALTEPAPSPVSATGSARLTPEIGHVYSR